MAWVSEMPLARVEHVVAPLHDVARVVRVAGLSWDDNGARQDGGRREEDGDECEFHLEGMATRVCYHFALKLIGRVSSLSLCVHSWCLRWWTAEECEHLSEPRLAGPNIRLLLFQLKSAWQILISLTNFYHSR